MNFTSDQWIIVPLVFVLGLLVGGFLFSGGGRKWKPRYHEEVTAAKRSSASIANARRMGKREKEWREQDSLRAAAIKDRNRDGRRR